MSLSPKTRKRLRPFIAFFVGGHKIELESTCVKEARREALRRATPAHGFGPLRYVREVTR